MISDSKARDKSGSISDVSDPSPDQSPVFGRKTPTELRAEFRRPTAKAKETETDKKIYKEAWEEVEELARQQQLVIDMAEIEELERERTDSEGSMGNKASRRTLNAREARDRRARTRSAKFPGESYFTPREAAVSESQMTESDDDVDVDSTAWSFDSTAQDPDVTARVFSPTEKTRERTEEQEKRQEENSRSVQVLEESKSSFRNGRTETERDRSAKTAMLTEPHLWQIKSSSPRSSRSQSPEDMYETSYQMGPGQFRQDDDYRATVQNQEDGQWTQRAKFTGKSCSTTWEVAISESQEKKDEDEDLLMRRQCLFDSTAQTYESAARPFDSAAQLPKPTTEPRQDQMLEAETRMNAIKKETEAARKEQQKEEEKQGKEVQVCIAKFAGNPLYIVTREAAIPEQQTADESAAQQRESTAWRDEIAAKWTPTGSGDKPKEQQTKEKKRKDRGNKRIEVAAGAKSNQQERPGESSDQRRVNEERGRFMLKASKKTRELRKAGWTRAEATKEAMRRTRLEEEKQVTSEGHAKGQQARRTERGEAPINWMADVYSRFWSSKGKTNEEDWNECEEESCAISNTDDTLVAIDQEEGSGDESPEQGSSGTQYETRYSTLRIGGVAVAGITERVPIQNKETEQQRPKRTSEKPMAEQLARFMQESITWTAECQIQEQLGGLREVEQSQGPKGEVQKLRSATADQPTKKETTKDRRGTGAEKVRAEIGDWQQTNEHEVDSEAKRNRKEQESRTETWRSSTQRRDGKERGGRAVEAATKAKELRKLGWTTLEAIKDAMTCVTEEQNARDKLANSTGSSKQAKVRIASQQLEQQAEEPECEQEQSARAKQENKDQKPRVEQRTDKVKGEGEMPKEEEVDRQEEMDSDEQFETIKKEAKGPKGTQGSQKKKKKRKKKGGKKGAEHKGKEKDPIKDVTQNSNQAHHHTEDLQGGGKRPPEPKADQ